jgi:hypothetical protein
MYAVAQHRPRELPFVAVLWAQACHSCRRRYDRTATHEFHELLFRHDTVLVFVHHARKLSHIPIRRRHGLPTGRKGRRRHRADDERRCDLPGPGHGVILMIEIRRHGGLRGANRLREREYGVAELVRAETGLAAGADLSGAADGNSHEAR